MDRRQALRKALADVLAGTIFIGFGGAFAIATLADYDVGTPLQMGPGFFPMMLGGLLVVLGIIVVGTGFVSEREEALGTFPWRAIVLIAIAFVVFGLSVRNVGVVPALFVTTLLAAFASERMGIVSGLVIAVGITIASVLIFIVALQLRLPLFGPWLEFLGL